MFVVAVILSRFVQYGGAAILFGASLFFLYSPLLGDTAPPRWTKPLLAGAALALAIATPLNFLAHTVELAGSLAAAMDPSALHTALLEMGFGKSCMVRFGLALAALAAAGLAPAGRQLWWTCAGAGAAICASFAWMGHGAATEGAPGWLHLSADIVHLLAAAAWIGALVVFSLAVLSKPHPNLQVALAAFSGSGTLFVSAIIASGLVNQAFLVGWSPYHIMGTTYGRVLAVKLALFAGMLLLAAANRFRHTPALKGILDVGREEHAAIVALRRSVTLETILAFGVLAAVSWLGTLPPVLEGG